ncbi:alpha/beta hydrolase [Mucilaginibacter calamicampi]|uniref:Alpha/beta hydrolase n=1 Tax=Mucilaginibacter calamicampi TaxID=1302352 RepID=A0ABW2YT58_9SPHI
MKKNLLLLLCLTALVINVKAAKVDTVETYSDAMKKKIKAVVVTPNKYAAGTQYPVVYLLHGASGNYSDWVKKGGKGVAENADLYNVILVCPDGGNTSWYWDSPVDPTYKYETYIINELIPYIDKSYKTIKSRTGRAITGLSMGGHGGLYLSIRHQDLFGAAGSMSGGVDIRPFPKNWDMAKRLGDPTTNADNWEKYTVTNMLDLLKPNALAIIFDCGTDDFFFKVNTELHDKLLERKIPHDFIIRPGAHNWPYWSNAVNYELLYFSTFFKKNNPQ